MRGWRLKPHSGGARKTRPSDAGRATSTTFTSAGSVNFALDNEAGAAARGILPPSNKKTLHAGDFQNEGVNNRVNNRVNNEVNNQLSDVLKKIIDALRENPKITQRELSKRISISLVHINKNMKFLQEKGIVSRNGNNKQGSWIVNEVSDEH